MFRLSRRNQQSSHSDRPRKRRGNQLYDADTIGQRKTLLGNGRTPLLLRRISCNRRRSGRRISRRPRRRPTRTSNPAQLIRHIKVRSERRTRRSSVNPLPKSQIKFKSILKTLKPKSRFNLRSAGTTQRENRRITHVLK